MVGATVMAHGDDAGLRLPPAVAPVQVVIVPIHRYDDERASVMAVAERLRAGLAGPGFGSVSTTASSIGPATSSPSGS